MADGRRSRMRAFDRRRGGPQGGGRHRGPLDRRRPLRAGPSGLGGSRSALLRHCRRGARVALSLKDRIAAELEEVRKRSLTLLEPVPEPDLIRQHSPLMSPLVWDLAHVGNYEEQWLLGALAQERCGAHLDDIYDAFAHPRRDRPTLPMLDPPAARRYIGEVRGRVIDVLDRIPL